MGAASSNDGRAGAAQARLRLLGCFELARGGTAERLPLLAQRLAALLAVRGGPVDRSRAAETLSPDVDHPHALANLRTALWRLRGSAHRTVRSDGSALRLSPDVAVDLRESEGLARRVLHGDIGRDVAMTAAEPLSRDVLPDWDVDWLVFDRERFRELRLHALERLCDRLTEMGEHAEAVECGLLAIEAEPLRESAYRALMRAHISEGNQAQALSQLRLLERQLWQELEVTPSQETIDLAMPPARI